MRASIDAQFFKKLFALALPISLQSMLFSVLGLVDMFMVAHLGTVPIAAVGLAGRVFFITFLLLAAMSNIVSVSGAQFFGAKQLDKVRQVICQGLFSSMILVLPVMLCCGLFPESVIGLATQDPELLKLASQFLAITAVSFICTAIVLPLESALYLAGEVKTPTYIGFITVFANGLLNGIFIFGWFGLPSMGVAGSALGTTIARFLQLSLLLYLLLKKHPELCPRSVDWLAALARQSWLKFLKMAVPLALHNGIWATGFFVYQSIFGRMSTEALSIVSLLAPFDAMLMSAFVGLSTATSIMLGHELGANNLQRAKHQSHVFLFTAPFLALMAAFITSLFSGEVVWLLGGMRNQLAGAETVLIVMAFGLCLKVLNLVGIIGILRSGGDIKYGMFIDQFGLWCVGIPIAYWAATVRHFPLHIVVALMFLEELSKAVLTIERVLRGVWVRNLTVSHSELRTE